MERGYVKAPWGQIHYFEAGEGEPVFLYPNRPRSMMIYRRLAELLATKYRVIAMDPPGFGRSDPLPEPFEVSDLAGAAIRVLDALGAEKIRASGHHTGADICIELAAGYPDRVVAIAPTGLLFLTEEERKGRLDGSLFSPAAGNPPKPDGSHLLPYLKKYPPLPPEDLEFVRDWMVDALESEPYQHASAHAVYRYREDLRMPLIKVPTLIMQSSGPGEPATLQRADEAAKLIPGAMVVTIEGGDIHYIHHRADEVSKILFDFFGSVDN